MSSHNQTTYFFLSLGLIIPLRRLPADVTCTGISLFKWTIANGYSIMHLKKLIAFCMSTKKLAIKKSIFSYLIYPILLLKKTESYQQSTTRRGHTQQYLISYHTVTPIFLKKRVSLCVSTAKLWNCLPCSSSLLSAPRVAD